ncbi:hypothetical protein [Nocardia miyunensis]|uniref:hypothetical protein n=1 Tax=Nocardia miyunensis TaxID=282684 RepID=UPI00082FE665|nr:hypothetical protein [Nocardia miyunensis]
MAVIHHTTLIPTKLDNTPDPDMDITRAAFDAPIIVRVNRIPIDGAPQGRCGLASGPWRTPEGREARGALLEAITVDERK